MIKFIKYFVYIFIVLLVLVSLIPKINTIDALKLNKEEIKLLKIKAKNKDFKAIERLYAYYAYSLRDYNKTTYILKLAAELGNTDYQVMLYNHLIKEKKYKEEALYWLKKAAKQNNKRAIEELKRYKNDNN